MTRLEPLAPGVYIRKRMEELFMTEEDLCEKMEFLNDYHVRAMLNGKLKITNKISNKLQEVLGLDAAELRAQYKSYIISVKALARS